MPRFNNFDRKPKKPVFVEAYEDGKYAPPTREKVGDGSAILEQIMFKDLQNIRTIDVHMDPNTELSHGAFPYTLIDKTNPVLEARYPGDKNIDGNTIVMVQNDTTSSKLMNTFDVGVINETINYLYLPIQNGAVNTALAGEMIKSIEQAVSFGFSTMLTELPFYSSSYDTTYTVANVSCEDLPVPTAVASKPAAGFYKALIHYQCVLQSLVAPISKYIEMRSLEKELMRMSFRTEAPIITEMFGLFKKAAFISIINTLGTVVINEYFDTNWYKQMNTLQCVPSRKTKGMTDPLLTIVAKHAIPQLKITKAGAGAAYYDYSSMGAPSTASIIDPEDYTLKTGTALSLEELINRAIKMMNPAYILRFARQYNHGDLPVGSIQSTSAYVEATKTLLTYINRNAAAFSTAMSDIRTFLDKLQQSDMVYWNKGTAFYVDKIAQLEPHFNALLADVFRARYGGSTSIKYDADTLRWRAWTFWNKYEGVAKFDVFSGGSFLTFGLRTISDQDSHGDSIDFSSSVGLIPVLFSNNEGDYGSMIVNRLGGYTTITSTAVTNASIRVNHYLARFNPLNSPSIAIKAATVSIDVDDEADCAALCSAALQFVANVFGFGVVAWSHEAEDPEDPDVTGSDWVVDPDYVCFLDLEVADVSNQMIVFARNYAPFRVDTPNGERTIGFATGRGN